MFPTTIISRLKYFLTGGGEGKDRKRKPVVPLDNIEAKKARMTNLSSIPVSADEGAGPYRPMAGVTQNGSHPSYGGTSAMATGSATGAASARRLSDLTDFPSRNPTVYGTHESAPFHAAPRPVISSRPLAKRSSNGPPMLIPIKTTVHAGASVEREYLRYAGAHGVSSRHMRQQQQNGGGGDLPTLLPLLDGEITGRTVHNTVPELTNEFKNLLRAKCSLAPYQQHHHRSPPVEQQSSNYITDLDRQLNVQREARKKYELLMKKFVPLPGEPTAGRAVGGNVLNRRSLNGDISRSSMRKPSCIETIELTDDEGDDHDEEQDEEHEDGDVQHVATTTSESAKCGQLFTTLGALQLATSMDESDRERERARKPKPPAVEVNTIKDKFQTKHVFRENIIQDVQQRYGPLFNSRKSLIEQERERLSRFTKNTAEQEGQMRNKMLNYVCSFYKFDVLDEAELEEAAKEPQEVPLPALTQAQVDLIHRKLRSGNEVVADKFNLKIRGNDLVTLQGSNWLNDEVINFYMELLRERSELKHDQGLPKVYTMNTFFLPRLLQTGHSGVRRWTRKVDLLAHDMIVVPVHVNGIHWCMSIVDMRRKTIHYYDSMGSPNNAVLNALENYLREESLDKRKEPFDTSGFTKANIRECPRQENGSDCGVFSCMFAEFLTRDHPITFDQSKMQYFRQKMMVEIVSSQLLT